MVYHLHDKKTNFRKGVTYDISPYIKVWYITKDVQLKKGTS
jgi:hypothetical protein